MTVDTPGWYLSFAERVCEEPVSSSRDRLVSVAVVLADERLAKGREELAALVRTIDVWSASASTLRGVVGAASERVAVLLGLVFEALFLPWPDRAEAEAFRLLSEAVTGFADLDPHLSDVHLIRLMMEPFGDSVRLALQFLAHVPGDEIAVSLSKRPALMTVVQALARQWYIGDTTIGAALTHPPSNLRAHFGALFWRAARAHPPMLPGGYFGHWRYPPEG